MNLSKNDVASITTNHANDYENVFKKNIVSLALLFLNYIYMDDYCLFAN